MSFIFSADGHIVEPSNLFTEGLPPGLQQYGFHARPHDGMMITFCGEKIISRTQLNRAPLPEDQEEFGRKNILGARQIDARLGDLAKEGIDAEIIFPSVGLFTYMIDNPDAELATAQIYNDWNNDFFKDHLERFVRCGILPVRDFSKTVGEIARLAGLGFTAALLPSVVPPGVPLYNQESWDPIFEAGARHGIVFVLHTATGRADVRSEKGPGGAIINYTNQMCDAQMSLMYMIAGGVLDRFPDAKVAVIESGASWLAGLAERMDEVNYAHRAFGIKPKLSITPSEIIRRQIYASFQYDRACIMSRAVTGHQALMWGSDYPHHEGTFPRSREVVAHLFDNIEITEEEKADIIGLNAARLFRLKVPELAVSS